MLKRYIYYILLMVMSDIYGIALGVFLNLKLRPRNKDENKEIAIKPAER